MKTTLLVAALLFSVNAWTHSAGVIPYACISDDAYVLLAFDPHPGRQAYGGFGGGDEEGETIAQTAAREFREETRCIFDSPTADELSTMKPSEHDGFYSYVTDVPFVSPLRFAHSPCDAEVERSDWLWVRWTDLSKALDSNASEPEVVASLVHKYIRIWDKAAASMRTAMADGLLPREGLCR